MQANQINQANQANVSNGDFNRANEDYLSGHAAHYAESSKTQHGQHSGSVSVPQPHQPSLPHVLTDAVKERLAAANRERRENLYPRLMQTLAQSEVASTQQTPSTKRILSLRQLAAANKARRSRLRESAGIFPAGE